MTQMRRECFRFTEEQWSKVEATHDRLHREDPLRFRTVADTVRDLISVGIDVHQRIEADARKHR